MQMTPNYTACVKEKKKLQNILAKKLNSQDVKKIAKNIHCLRANGTVVLKLNKEAGKIATKLGKKLKLLYFFSQICKT